MFLEKLVPLFVTHGIKIPDLNLSDPDFTEKAQAILLGLAGMNE